MNLRVAAIVMGLSGLLPIAAHAQHHADLAPAEIDQLRDAAMEPDVRLKLYLKFARARMATLEQVRTDPKVAAADRPKETHARLQDFQDLYDELNDNIDTYVDRKEDIRKVLKNVIEADVEFQNKLKAFADAGVAANEDTKPYQFVLTSLIETVNSSTEDHRQLLDEQEEAAKHKKKQQNRAGANEQKPVIR
jgi:flagellar biosynthesis chaperone FliJ